MPRNLYFCKFPGDPVTILGNPSPFSAASSSGILFGESQSEKRKNVYFYQTRDPKEGQGLSPLLHLRASGLRLLLWLRLGREGSHGVGVRTVTCTEAPQSCPTLCDPIDGSPPGSSVHGICQARVLEWVAIAFSGKIIYTYMYN